MEEEQEPPPLNVLFFTLEFVDPIFSGNGVHSRTCVEALLLRGCNVYVVCGRPKTSDDNNNEEKGSGTSSSSNLLSSNPVLHEAYVSKRLHIKVLPLRIWGHVSRQGPWEEYNTLATEQATSIAIDYNNSVKKSTTNIVSNIVCGVDWTSWRAAESCRKKLTDDIGIVTLPMVHLNFRVYYEQPEQMQDDDVEFYLREEISAVTRSTSVVALTQADLDALDLAIPTSCQERHVLAPPLRSDVEVAAKSIFDASAGSITAASWARGRKYITCCARVCEEKNILNGFVQLMEVIGYEKLAAKGYVPLIFGRQTSPDYAKKCVDRLKSAFPKEGACEIRDFGDAKAMAEMWSKTKLNIHSSVYESYGMVPVEAAAFNVPTLCHNGKIMGFCDLLLEESNEVYRTNLKQLNEAASFVCNLLGLHEDEDVDDTVVNEKLSATANNACKKSLSWNVEAFSRRINNTCTFKR